jgi:hypothetical protein
MYLPYILFPEESFRKIRWIEGLEKIRGVRPVVTIDSAKKFAGRQGYCWVPNPYTDLPYDAIAYRDHDAIAIRVRTSRHLPGRHDMWEDFFYDDVEILKALPMPEWINRELWVRYVWSRVFQRYRLLGDKLNEINMVDREKPVFDKRRKKAIPPSGSASVQGPEVK